MEQGTPTKSKQLTAGGSATAGGIRFQATVTAIAEVYLARGDTLQWLTGLVADVPVAIAAETGGPGDDINITLHGGEAVEVQVKRGLRADTRLWIALLSLSRGVQSGQANYGVLVVSPDSSATIRTELAIDIVRMGEGRNDGLRQLAQAFSSRLAAERLDVQTVCQRLRIVTVHALDQDRASIQASRVALASLCKEARQIDEAWKALCDDSLGLIERRGRRDASSVLRVLDAAGIARNSSPPAPVNFLAELCSWVVQTNKDFSVFGIEKPLPLDESWIPLNLVVRTADAKAPTGLQEALDQYHDWHKRDFGGSNSVIAPESLTRFFPHCVVVAGPGMGKSTYIKKLARIFSSELMPVLKVSLPLVASRVRQGSSFEEALFAHALDSSGLTAKDGIDSKIHNWVLLCDGLDECGSFQEVIAQSLLAFVASHPMVRALVTTRPVGYVTTLLNSWRHYEVLPLEADKYGEHLKKLLSGIMPNDPRGAEETRAFAVSEVDRNKSAEVVTRSPLLLGLSLALAMQRLPFGESKSQLYEKLFAIIDRIPTVRKPPNGPSSAILARFLDVVGWDMAFHPVSTMNDIVGRSAAVLAQDLNSTPLQAAEQCERCSDYWQSVGMLERVQHAGEETLSFVHKTFCEFAAARYLVAMEGGKLAEQVAMVFGQEASNEVIAFAGSIGAADVICRELLKHTTTFDGMKRNVPRALALLLEPNHKPDATARGQAITVASNLLASPDREASDNTGMALLPVAKMYPDDVAPSVQPLIQHEQVWTRLAAWTTVLACGESYFDLEQLVDAFETLPREGRGGVSSSLAGHLVLDHNGFKLMQTFALSAMRVVLTRLDAAEADKIIKDVFSNNSLQSYGTTRKAHALLRAFGREYTLVKYSDSLTKRMQELELDHAGYEKMNHIAFSRMFQPLANPPGQRRPRPAPHYQVSALMSMTGVWEMGASDIWGWRSTSLLREEEAVVRATGIASGLDLHEVAEDVDGSLLFIKHAKGERLASIFDCVVHIDAPALDWSKVVPSSVDLDCIERALHHESDWLVGLATNLMAAVSPLDQLPAIVARLLANGTGNTLWAAAQLAEMLDVSECRSLLYERLNQPIRSGCEYLLRAIQNGTPPLDDRLFAVLESVLLGKNANVAVAAAKLALALSDYPSAKLADLLTRSYAHWQTNEEPYPKESGSVPPSPRAEIVGSLQKLRALSKDELFQMCSDPRSDVREVISKVMLERLSTDKGFFDEYIERVVHQDSPPQTLIEFLRSKKPLGGEQIDSVRDLLKHSIPRVRYAALGILDVTYLSVDEVRALATALRSDRVSEVRERAGRILHFL